MLAKDKLGKTGERIAEKFLKEKGYFILAKNYRKPWGEIDIIAEQNKEIIFVEVKTRTSNNKNPVLPETAVNYYKQRKIIKTAQTYLLEKSYHEETPWRIDVIAIEVSALKEHPLITHIENAVWE